MNSHFAKVGKPTLWPPGKSGNPAGKPPGTRTAFSQGFIHAANAPRKSPVKHGFCERNSPPMRLNAVDSRDGCEAIQGPPLRTPRVGTDAFRRPEDLRRRVATRRQPSERSRARALLPTPGRQVSDVH
jgi:hypothetical protein